MFPVYKPEQSQIHDIWSYRTSKRHRNKTRERSSQTLFIAQIHSALKGAQGATIYTSDASKFHRCQAARRNDRQIDQFCSAGLSKRTHPKQLKLYCYKLQRNDAETHAEDSPICYISYRANTTQSNFFAALCNIFAIFRQVCDIIAAL